MENQLVTITGMYKEGQIVPLSAFLPKGSYRVLITFLEPIDEKKDEPQSTGSEALSQEDINQLRIDKYGISRREMEIFQLLRQGCTNREISAKVELGDGTVRNYISSMLEKLKADNRTQLVKFAIDKGILPPN